MTITLLTDFGTRDGYVAAMKGVIAAEAPGVSVVDATHDVPPQDIRFGAWALAQYADYFPRGTIHVAVIDPGVGTHRQALLAGADGQYFLAPDNGLLAWVMDQATELTVRRLRPTVHRPGEVSSTFHGRDVFAYVAARLAAGRARPDEISDPATAYVRPDWMHARCDKQRIDGEIIHVDRFGNLITNIRQDQLVALNGPQTVLQAGPHRFSGLNRTYSDVKTGEPVALVGSSGWVELAVRDGSARDVLRLDRGHRVTVTPYAST